MNHSYASVFVSSVMLLVAGAPAWASETTTYTYDALGRLVSASNSGGPRSGRQTQTSFDPAGNRTAHAVGLALPSLPTAATFSISGPGTVSEGQSAVFTISKNTPTGAASTVNYATVNGSAAAPGDFAAASGTLTFQGWETSKTVAIPVLSDSVYEPSSESFSVSLSSPTGGPTISVATASAVTAPEPPPNNPPHTVADTLSVGVCTAGETNVLANDSDPDGDALTVISASGGGTKGSPYVAGSGVVGFTAYGETGSASVTYTVQDSRGATANGTLAVTVTAGSGCN